MCVCVFTISCYCCVVAAHTSRRCVFVCCDNIHTFMYACWSIANWHLHMQHISGAADELGLGHDADHIHITDLGDCGCVVSCFRLCYCFFFFVHIFTLYIQHIVCMYVQVFLFFFFCFHFGSLEIGPQTRVTPFRKRNKMKMKTKTGSIRIRCKKDEI